MEKGERAGQSTAQDRGIYVADAVLGEHSYLASCRSAWLKKLFLAPTSIDELGKGRKGDGYNGRMG